MIRQTIAIFIDAYRYLNSKWLFWVTLLLTAIIVGFFSGIGVNERGLTIFCWELEIPFINSRFFPPDVFYKMLFVNWGVKFWLTWVATGLALISTVGIFPDLMSNGSIDLVASKPIRRIHLFICQYLAGLLFMTLQVLLFCTIAWLVIGIRGGSWDASIFWAVPIVVCFFSYLFSVAVLAGVLTRSPLTAFLLTIVFWAFIAVVGWTESGLAFAQTAIEMREELGFDALAPPHKQDLTDDDASDADQLTADEETPPEPNTKAERNPPINIDTVHSWFYNALTVLPKTDATIGMLDTKLTSVEEMYPYQAPQEGIGRRMYARMQIEKSFVKKMAQRSVFWIVGTSLLFELIVLSLAAWIFCRKDY